MWMKLFQVQFVYPCVAMTQEIEKLLGQGKWQEAQAKAEQMILAQPVNRRAHAYLVLSLYRQGKLEQAVSSLKKATILDEEFWEAGTKLAQCLDQLQRYEEALEVVEQFLAIKPSDSTLLHLESGLRRNVPEKITDSWQKTTFLDHHHVELTHRD